VRAHKFEEPCEFWRTSTPPRLPRAAWSPSVAPEPARQTRILHISGYTDDTVLRHGVAKAEAALLQKPFTADALTRKVQEALEEPPMVAARVAGA
jgi:hypothetical protein